MANKLIIFGLGEQAEIAHFYFSKFTSYEVAAFTVDDEFSGEQSLIPGVPVIPFSKIQTHCPREDHAAFVAIGYSKMNVLRRQKYDQMKALSYKFASYVSERATNYSTSIGENCFILEDNTIQPLVHIGNNVTLWSGNHIGHHSRVMDDCFITSHVVISGGCIIGEKTFIGVNSTLRDHITIGKSNMIGAGSLILSDTEDGSVYMTGMSEKSRVPSHRLRGI